MVRRRHENHHGNSARRRARATWSSADQADLQVEEARGHSERMFGTLQGRLPKDLRLAGITTVEAANACLKAHYIVGDNAAFAIKPEKEGTAFIADAHEVWREALCVIEERTV